MTTYWAKGGGGPHPRGKKHIQVDRRGWDTKHPINLTHNEMRPLMIQENSKPTASPRGAMGLNSTSGTPTFKICTWETSPQNIQLWKPKALASTRPTGRKQPEKKHLDSPAPGRSAEGAGAKAPRLPVKEGWFAYLEVSWGPGMWYHAHLESWW